MIHLLFEEEPVNPNYNIIKKDLERKFGDVDVVSKNELLTSFAINKYSSKFKEGCILPQVAVAEIHKFNENSIDEFSRNQLWDVEDGDKLLATCKYEVFIFDLMASVLKYKERCELLMDLVEVALEIFPKCKDVCFKSSGKLFESDKIKSNKINREDRFIYFAVNVRVFNIEGTDEKIVDTLGLYAIGLPDIQQHFHNLNVNDVVNHAYNVASYIYDKCNPIENGETIDGIENGALNGNVRWACKYEESLIQPIRTVVDVRTGKFASGQRS